MSRMINRKRAHGVGNQDEWQIISIVQGATNAVYPYQ